VSAKRFLIKAIENNVKPEIINIDKSGANTAAKNHTIEEIIQI
jgi:transposase-like protein